MSTKQIIETSLAGLGARRRSGAGGRRSAASCWVAQGSRPVISSANDSPSPGKGQGRQHEATDLCAITRPITAFNAMVRNPAEGPELIAQAFTAFRSCQPRPVHIAIPIIIWHNHSYAMIRNGMVELCIPEISVNPQAPDFVKLARACACPGIRVDSEASFRQALNTARA